MKSECLGSDSCPHSSAVWFQTCYITSLCLSVHCENYTEFVHMSTLVWGQEDRKCSKESEFIREG